MIALCNGTVEEAQGSDSSLISAGRMLALPPDREAVSARSGRARERTSISIPPCPCIGTRCEPRSRTAGRSGPVAKRTLLEVEHGPCPCGYGTFVPGFPLFVSNEH